MTAIKNTIIFFFLILSNSSFGQNSCGITVDTIKIYLDENFDNFLSALQSQNFETSKDKNQIPNKIKEYLNCLTKDDFSIANPNEEYRCCCTSSNKLPRRRLLFFSQSKDIFLITYLTGGIGVSTTILMFKLQDNKIVDLWTGYGAQEFKSKNEVVKHMKKKREIEFGLQGDIAL